MDSSFWTAVSGTEAREQQLQVVANNIANVNTVGFKKDGVDFETFIKNRDNPDPSNSVPRDLLTLKQQYPLDGNESVGSITNKTYADYSQGSLDKTDDPFHLAFNGQGFFQVLTPEGLRLTRAGNFQVRRDGILSTLQGYPVLKSGVTEEGTDYQTIINQRGIRVEGRFSVGKDGSLKINGVNQGKLSIVEPENYQALKKQGNALMENLGPLKDAKPEIAQGFLEKSNVNAVKELAEMLQVNRAFEAGQKVIKAIDSINAKGVNEIGKIY